MINNTGKSEAPFTRVYLVLLKHLVLSAMVSGLWVNAHAAYLMSNPK